MTSIDPVPMESSTVRPSALRHLRRAAVLAMLAVTCCGQSAWAEGGNGQARAYIQDIATNTTLYPRVLFGGREPLTRYVPPRPAASDFDALRARAAGVLEALRAGRFRILEPIETADRIEDLDLYRTLQPECSDQPVLMWDPGAGPGDSSVRAQLDLPSDLTGFELDRQVLAPRPGEPRPVDYERIFLGGKRLSTALGRLALYRLSTEASGGQGLSGLYVLRAETFPGYSQRTGEVTSTPHVVGIMSAFEIPSCRFRGSLEFPPSSAAFAVGVLPGQFEIVEIDGSPFVLAIRESRRHEDLPPDITILVWEVVVSGDPDGHHYGLSQVPARQ